MKTKISLLLILIALTACNKPAPAPEPPVATPTPTATPAPATPTPTPTPEATATPTPAPSLPEITYQKTPEGVLYVVKAFTVETEGGLTRFVKGKKVTIVTEDAESYTVTDGTTQGTAPRASFTDDQAMADEILLGLKSAAVTPPPTAQPAPTAAPQISSPATATKPDNSKKIRVIEENIAKANTAISEMQKIIQDHQQDYNRKMNLHLYHGKPKPMVRESAEDKQRKEKIDELQKLIPTWQAEIQTLRAN